MIACSQGSVTIKNKDMLKQLKWRYQCCKRCWCFEWIYRHILVSEQPLCHLTTGHYTPDKPIRTYIQAAACGSSKPSPCEWNPQKIVISKISQGLELPVTCQANASAVGIFGSLMQLRKRANFKQIPLNLICPLPSLPGLNHLKYLRYVATSDIAGNMEEKKVQSNKQKQTNAKRWFSFWKKKLFKENDGVR